MKNYYKLHGKSSLILLILIVFTLLTAFTYATDSPQFDRAPLSPEFEEYLAWLNEPQRMGTPDKYGRGLIIPAPVKRFTSLKVVSASYNSGSGSIPATYDLRTLGRVSSVKDRGTCTTADWAIAVCDSLESNLLPGENRDFSENNLKNTHGFDLASGVSGNIDMAVAYLARWSGPVSEADDPYNPGSNISPLGVTPQKHVQEVWYLCSQEDIKRVIMDGHGAVTAEMYWDDLYFNFGTKAYYRNTDNNTTNHMVTIVGWDDNFSTANFNYTPFNKGAWLVKDNRGTGWGDGGYFYLSYYDLSSPRNCTLFLAAEPVNNYDKIYQYDPYGYTKGIEGLGMANIFTSQADELLAAVSFYTLTPNTTYTVKVYTGVTTSPTSGILQDNATASGTIDYIGYHTITLPDKVRLTPGQKFSVVVYLNNPYNMFPLALEGRMNGYSSAATSSGKGYVSVNGTSWQNLTADDVCLKAFTMTLPVISKQPAGQTVNEGMNVTFNVTASGADSYQWQYNGVNLVDGWQISGSTTANLTIQNISQADNGKFTVVVTNARGSVTSSPATLTVKIPPPPVITKQPVNQIVNEGANATFSVTATNANTYQWQYNGDNLVDGGQISGSTTTNLKLSNVITDNSGVYAVVVANNKGLATSSPATLTVRGTLPAPTFQPDSRSFTSPGKVLIRCTEPGAVIHYSLSGKGPTLKDPIAKPNVPVTISKTATLMAKAWKTGWPTSPTKTAVYTVNDTVATPTFNLKPGTYTVAQNVTIGCTTPGATIRYTTDDTEPTVSSQVYNGAAIIIPYNYGQANRMTIKAKAWLDGWDLSATATAAYTVTGIVPAPKFSLPGGVYYTAQNIKITCDMTGVAIRYTTDGTTPSATVGTPYVSGKVIPLKTTAPLKAVAFKAGLADSVVTSAEYTITGTLLAPTIVTKPCTFKDSLNIEMHANNSGAQIRYTIDGSIPGSASALYNAPFQITGTTTVKAKAFLTDWKDSAVATATYTGTVAAPEADTPGGTYNTEQTVKLACTTSGATIRYTTSAATAPTSKSPAFPAEGLLVNKNMTINAKAFKTGWAASTSLILNYTINEVATPRFSPAGGVYYTPQTVKIYCDTPGAIIRYTTNDYDINNETEGMAYTSKTVIKLNETTTLKARAFIIKNGSVTGSSAQKAVNYSITGTLLAPTIVTKPCTFKDSLNIEMHANNNGAQIRYTTDGSTPGSASALYNAPFQITGTTTVKAKAFLTDWKDSAVVSATYTGTVAAPVADIGGGTYDTEQLVKLTCATDGATIRYTTSAATAPTSKSPAFPAAGLLVNKNMIINARAFKTAWATSTSLILNYTINGVASPTFSVPAGTYQKTQKVLISCITTGTTIRYTTNGDEPTPTTGNLYKPGTIINVSMSLTLKAIAYKTNDPAITSPVKTAKYEITGTVAKPVFDQIAGSYPSAINVAISCATGGAEIHYTTNGKEPTMSDPTVTSGSIITIETTTILKAKAFKTDWLPSAANTANYTILQVATPSFSIKDEADGSQTVTVTCATPGAVIRYTTNGNDPSLSDPVIASGASITINTGVVLKARAWKTGLTTSEVAVTIRYTLTINNSGNGNTAPAGNITVCHGSRTIITAIPNDGYQFVNWEKTAGEGNVVFSSANSASTTATVTGGNVTIQANFTISRYILKVIGSGHGQTNPAGGILVDQGALTAISAIPNDGYHFVNWEKTAGTGTVTFDDPDSADTNVKITGGDATIKANFAINQYNLTITSDENGSTNPSGALAVNYGARNAVTAIPQAGYLFAYWEQTAGTGTVVFGSAGSASTIVTLTGGDATIKANFAPIAPIINIKQGQSNISNGTGSYDFGNVTVTADGEAVFTIENKGNVNLSLADVQINGTDASQFSVSSQPSRTIIPGGNTTFTVRFAPTGIGIRNATIKVINNDVDMNPYSFTITGNGTVDGILPLNVWTPGEISATGEKKIYYFNADIGKSYVVNWDEIGCSGVYTADVSVSAYRKDINNTYFSDVNTGFGTPQTIIAQDDIVYIEVSGNAYSTFQTGTFALKVRLNKPTMEVKQDTTNIARGIYNYGNVAIGSNKSATFTIENIGPLDLNLTDTTKVQITGENASCFSVTSQPSLSSISENNSTTFTIRFTSTGVGIKTANVSIASNDPENNPYTFTITGTGPVEALTLGAWTPGNIAAGEAKIYSFDAVIGNNYAIAWDDSAEGSGSYNGNVMVSAYQSNMSTSYFSAVNSGYATPLVITAQNNIVYIKVVGFNTSSTGSFALKATFNEPVINLKQGMVNIPNGTGSYDFGSVPLLSGSNATFTIQNTGVGKLNLTDTPKVQISGTGASCFSVTAQPSSPVAPNGSITFMVNFTPAGTEVKTATVSITNNDADQSPYTFIITGSGAVQTVTPGDWNPGTIAAGEVKTYSFAAAAGQSYAITWDDGAQGSGGYTGDVKVSAYRPNLTDAYFSDIDSGYISPQIINAQDNIVYIKVSGLNASSTGSYAVKACLNEPVINIKQGTTNIPNSGSCDFGNVSLLASRYVTFTIQNNGGGSLNLTDTPKVQISGADAAWFSLSQPSSPLSPNDFTTFTVKFTPTGTEAKTATVSIISNDADQSPYTFTITGKGTVQTVTLDSWTPGTIAAGEVKTYSFAATAGQDYAIFWDDSVQGSGSYTGNIKVSVYRPDLTSTYFSDIDSGYTSPRIVRALDNMVYIKVSGLNASSTGTFAVKAGLSEPVINVKQGAANIPNGTGIYNFGNVPLLSGNNITFTVQNTGTNNLNLTDTTKVRINGDNSFSITAQPAASVSPGGSTTFSVSFTPTGIGDKNATVSIVNNDPDLTPYTFTIKGTGTAITGNLGSWTTGSIATAGETKTYSFSVTDGQVYAVTWNDAVQGSGSYNGKIKVSAYQPDLATAYFTDANSGYKTPQVFTAVGSTVYIKVAGYSASSTGTFAIKTCLNEPAISIKQGAADLLSGTGNYNFGSFPVYSNVAAVFTIQNTGTSNLNLAADTQKVVITGDGAANFSVTAQPASPVGPNSSTTFTICFIPASTGVRTATVKITNDDADLNSYTFIITGTGTVQTGTAGSWTTGTISSPGEIKTYAFNVTAGQNYAVTWNDSAEGAGNTTGDIKVTAYQEDFTTPYFIDINSGYNSPQVFKAQGTMVYVKVAGNSSSSTGSFALKTCLNEPAINVKQGTTDISNGTSYNCGNVALSFNSSINFAVQNTGTAPLNLTDSPIVKVTGDDVSCFVVTAQPVPTVAPNGSATFTVKFTPNGPGVKTATVNIANNSTGPNPYTFTITGTGTGTIVDLPLEHWREDCTTTNDEVKIYRINTIPGKVYNISWDDAGDDGSGNYPDYLGGLDIKVSAYRQDFATTYFTNVDNGYTTPQTIIALESVVYLKIFRNTDWGTGSFALIAKWAGEAIMTLKQGSNDIPNGTGSYDFGSILRNSSKVVEFTIGNTGNINLIPANIQITGDGASSFSVTLQPSLTGPGSSGIFKIAFNPTSIGRKTALISIPTNDLDQNPYTFTITGTCIAPVINVKQGTTDIPNNTGSYNYGDVAAFSSRNAIFTIYNTGTSDLHLTGNPRISLSGAGASSFTLFTDASSLVTPGGNTTFTVRFNPTDVGTKTAKVSITNDDQNYTFNLTGNATSGSKIPITLGGWTTGDIIETGEIKYYWISATSGNRYDVTWDDSVDGSGTYTGDIEVTAQTLSLASGYFSYDSGYSTLRVVTPVESAFVLKVVGKATGSFAIKVSNSKPKIKVIRSGADAYRYDCGFVEIGSSTYFGFTVKNVGTADLHLTNNPTVEINGDTDNSFQVTDYPDSIIAPGTDNSLIFKFQPMSWGAKEASAYIANDDVGYSLMLTGVAVDHVLPLTLDAWNDGNIANAGEEIVYYFNTTVDQSYVITWKDFGEYTGDVIVSAYRSDAFTPYFSDKRGGYDTPWVVTARDDKIYIKVKSYNYYTTGTFTVKASLNKPIMNVKQGTAANISNGTGSYNFGTVPVLWNNEAVFTIQNNGGLNLSFTDTPKVRITGADASCFSVTTEPSSPVMSNSSTNFTIRFMPNGPEIKTATVSIANNDSDKNPYTFTITGTGTTDKPVLNIKQGAADILNGIGIYNFGSVSQLSPVNTTFTIKNQGVLDLNLTGSPRVQITGENAADFAVIAQPSSPLSPGSSGTFTIRFNPLNTGVRTATVSITSNDGDHNPYTFTISGTGTFDVTEISPGSWTSGTISTAGEEKIYSFNAVPGKSYTIIWDDSSQGSGAYNGDIIVTAYHYDKTTAYFSDISNGYTYPRVITIPESGIDYESVYLKVVGNSAGSFAIKAIYDEPIINVKRGTTTVIPNGGIFDFGYTDGGGRPLGFTIENNGTLALNLTSAAKIEVGGANASCFSVYDIPYSSTIPAGGSTYFTIKFTPDSIGAKTATIMIANDDLDRNPYIFTVTGYGINLNPLTADVWATGNIVNPGDTIFYSFVTGAAGNYAISWDDYAQSGTYSGNVRVSAYKSDGVTPFFENIDEGYNSPQIINTQSYETIYIKVESSLASTGTFAIKADLSE